MRSLVLLIVFLLFCPRPAMATFTTFSASGLLTRLDETTYRLSIYGYLWGNDPLLSPAYPFGAYTLNSTYTVTGPFGTPFNPEGGMFHYLGHNHAYAAYMPYRWAGLTNFAFDFELPDGHDTPRLFMNLAIEAEIWHWVMNSPYDQYWPVGRLAGSGAVFADLPTTIGSSNPVEQTPEPSSVALILLGSAVLPLVQGIGASRRLSR